MAGLAKWVDYAYLLLDPMQNAPDAANHKITSELRWAWPYLKIPPATYFVRGRLCEAISCLICPD